MAWYSTFPAKRPVFDNQILGVHELIESVGDPTKLYERVHVCANYPSEYGTAELSISNPFYITKLDNRRFYGHRVKPYGDCDSCKEEGFYSDNGLIPYDSGVWNPTNYIRPYKPEPVSTWTDDWM